MTVPPCVALALRGFVQVCLVAANTALIARGDAIGVALIGFAISWAWWGNTGRAAHDTQNTRGRCAYAIGASAGAVSGMWIVAWGAAHF